MCIGKNTQHLFGWMYQQAITLSAPLWHWVYRLLRRAKEAICSKHLKGCRSPQYPEAAEDDRNHGSLLLCKASSNQKPQDISPWGSQGLQETKKWRPKNLLGWENLHPDWGCLHSGLSAAVVICKLSALKKHFFFFFFLMELCRDILCQHLKFIKISLTSTYGIATDLLHSIFW